MIETATQLREQTYLHETFLNSLDYYIFQPTSGILYEPMAVENILLTWCFFPENKLN